VDNPDRAVYQFSGGEVYFWIEQGTSIHLRARTQHGDPVELSSEEAREIAEMLMQSADEIDRQDG